MSSPLLFCNTCNKPYTKELSYKRHVAYCLRARNRPRVRQRSCRACGSAKTKCDFQSPCSRCSNKGIACVYEASIAPGKSSSTPNASVPLRTSDSASVDSPPELQRPGLQEYVATNIDMFRPFDRLSQLISCLDFPLHMDPPTILSSPEEMQNSFQQLNSATDLELIMGSFVQNLTEAQAAGLANAQIPSSSFKPSRWTDKDKFLNALGIPRSIHPQLNNSILRTLKMGDPVAQHSASLILQAFRSFPRMMIRRETFPCFVHPHWNEYLGNCLNLTHREPLVNCMRISNIFASKSHESKASMWSMIRAEELRFAENVDNMPPDHLMSAIQASSIYIIIRFLDNSPHEPVQALQMLLYFQVLCERMRQHMDGVFFSYEHVTPNRTWDSWILAENCRRMAIVWFLMGRVVGLTTGIPCASADDCRSLPLPCARAVWEARSYTAWENEYVNFYHKEPQELKTYGDLIDAHERSDDPRYAELIDCWNASTDGVGYLMNLAMPIV